MAPAPMMAILIATSRFRDSSLLFLRYRDQKEGPPVLLVHGRIAQLIGVVVGGAPKLRSGSTLNLRSEETGDCLGTGQHESRARHAVSTVLWVQRKVFITLSPMGVFTVIAR